MVQAIGSASSANAGAAAASLEAQLDRYQKQLSDCVNCDSAKTPEGKQQIAAIAGKISVLKERIDQSPEVKAGAQAAQLGARPPRATDDRASSAAAVNDTGAGSSPKTKPADQTATLGSVVDVFA
ncbi:hypothetical protein AAKU55_000201 [Oxalobacteraceae bacterium GrIS 1.11]